MHGPPKKVCRDLGFKMGLEASLLKATWKPSQVSALRNALAKGIRGGEVQRDAYPKKSMYIAIR